MSPTYHQEFLLKQMEEHVANGLSLGLHELDIESDRDLVSNENAAGLDGRVPGQAETLDNGQAGSYQMIRKFACAHGIWESSKSGDVKGTIRSDMWLRFVPNDVRRHRLISSSYISLLPCHGTAKW